MGAVVVAQGNPGPAGAGSSPGPSHTPVLVAEVLALLGPALDGLVVDGTAGGGGHAEAILRAAPAARVLGLDRDPVAVAAAEARLAPFGSRARVVLANFIDLGRVLRETGEAGPAAVLLDLGTSGFQLGEPARGFSFQAEGPLDMRMGPDAPVTVAELLRTTSEGELARIIFAFGEERHSRRIARRLVADRAAIRTTADLARVVASCIPGAGRERIHPATRTFQALRIAVNGELDAVEAVLPQALDALRSGGRLAVIAFHSLEDRIVKRFLAREARDCLCPPEVARCACGHLRRLAVLTRKPVTAGGDEAAANPRARSAKLRGAVKA